MPAFAAQQRQPVLRKHCFDVTVPDIHSSSAEATVIRTTMLPYTGS
jgi:hypothetical protein